MGYEPESLPHIADEPGPGRFDDPRPRTEDRFLIRYAASTLRGCLLELLASFRLDPEAHRRVQEVDDAEDEDLVEEPEAEPWQALADYLDTRKVARLRADGLVVTSLNDPLVQRQLNEEPVVRAVLDSGPARAALLEANSRGAVHLDNAAVKLSSPTGRLITQACALALHDLPERPDCIHYRSRHDDAEDCWAIFGDVPVITEESVPLSASVAEHVEAMRSVAELWDLPLPPTWQS